MEFIAKEEGYLMTYMANETNEDLNVFMDDMTVTHTTGPIVRVDDYYPFGLTFNSSKLDGKLTNKFLYNGKEKEELTDWYDYGARMYMADIGRWTIIDPLAIKYNDLSPYNYVANNPTRFIDPDGREIEGITKNDAKKLHEDLNAIFADEKFAAFRSLITRTGKKGNGKKFNKIDSDALTTAFEGVELSADEQALVDIVTGAINSDDTHLVEFAQADQNISSTGEEIMSGALPAALVDPVKAANGGLPASIISAFGGAGITTSTDNGTYSLIIEGLDVSKSGTDYFNSTTKSFSNNPVGRASTTGHEVFGHGRSLSLGRTDASSQHIDAIQTENLILRVMGVW